MLHQKFGRKAIPWRIYFSWNSTHSENLLENTASSSLDKSSRKLISLVRFFLSFFFFVDDTFEERDSRGRAAGIFVSNHFLGDLHSVKTSLSAK